MDAITQLLTRGVDKIYPSSDALEKILRSGKKLTLYQGFDPTGTQLHIGHAVGFRKLRQFQDLGHKVIFVIGDGTGQAGDPSGKKTAREKFFTTEELRENGKNYVMQASKLIRFEGENAVEIRYNGDWLNTLSLTQLLDIAGKVTLQQMLERDLYQERLKSNIDLSLREFLYPLLQGYDSVAMNVDLELGGSDQTFNMLMGRKLVRSYLNKEKFVMTTPLLADSKGVKIGKSEGNVIALTDAPADLYAKIMSLGDDAIIPGFTLLTDRDIDEIQHIQADMTSGKNPMEYKKQLAHAITSQLHSNADATTAQSQFEQTFQQKSQSKTMGVVVHIPSGSTIYEALMSEPISLSKSEIRRQVAAGSIDVNSITLTPETAKQILNDGDTIKKGTHTFIRVAITK